MRGIFDRVLPAPLMGRLRKLNETRALKALPKRSSKTDMLLPSERVDLEGIFGSSQIASDWKTAAKTLKGVDIPDGIGGVNPGDRRAVFYLIRHFRPCSILEIGTHIGASTMYMTAALMADKDDGSREPRRLVSVDIANVNDPLNGPWVQYKLKRSPSDTISMLGGGHIVDFVTETSLGYLSRSSQRYDFIFLDGDHAAKTVYQEIPAALELLKQDGLLLLHDYFPGCNPLWADRVVIPGPFLATEQLKADGARFRVFPLGRLPWKTKGESHVTSLALLARAPR